MSLFIMKASANLFPHSEPLTMLSAFIISTDLGWGYFFISVVYFLMADNFVCKSLFVSSKYKLGSKLTGFRYPVLDKISHERTVHF